MFYLKVYHLLSLGVLRILLIPKGIQGLVCTLIDCSESQDRRDVGTGLDPLFFEIPKKSLRIREVDSAACKRAIAFLELLAMFVNVVTWRT